MTFRQIVIEESLKRGVREEAIVAALQKATLTVGQCGSEKEVPPGEEAEARKSVNDLIDLVTKMSPEQRMIARAMLKFRAAYNAKNN